ncbi:MAG: diacylglycerol kinase family lipid kinase [Lachnospiraceae bacterium]|nr:diacylglycerol kinase family lipid kinase [Lachnospiraceae bacterium]
MKKLLYIFNGRAGHGANVLRKYLLDIVTMFNDKGYAVTVITTKHPNHAAELVEEYAGYFDLILCSGGDGTVNEIVNGMTKLPEDLRKPIAYIPTGTTNDYGTSLGLPKEISSCIQQIAAEKPFSVDVGKLNDKAFVYVAAIGTPVKVTYTTSQEDKNVWGYMAYVAELLKLLPATRPYHLKIESGDRVIEGDYLFAFVTNSYSVSGFKGVTGRDVSLNDGLFEVTLVKAVKNLAELVIPMGTLSQEVPDKRYIERFKTDHLIIECSEEAEWNADGEFGGKYKKTEISVMHNAVSFMV